MTTARSIDAAANGYIRHRFVRALSASFVVGAVFSLLVIALGAVANAVRIGAWDQVAIAPLGLLLILILFLLPIALVVGVLGAVVDALHRRLIGLAVFVFGGAMLFFCAASIFYAVAVLNGYLDENSDANVVNEALWFGAFSVVAVLIGYQLVRQGWWQMTSRPDDFRAVRGWRPPAWRLFTSFRRHLGLPSFLSHVGRKRRVVSLLYFGVASLNLGLLMLLMLPVLIGFASDDPQINEPLVYGIMGALLLLNVFGAGGLLAKLADTRATALYQNVREWDARAPIVFLRAFDQDAARLKARSGDVFARWPAGVGRSRTLDEILLEHGSPYGPVIAIGDPRDPTPPLGAARVFVPGEGNGWQDVVRGIAGASKAVVMCPNRGEGVQWELDLIAQAGGRLQVIFLASPELDRAATLELFKQLVPDMLEIDARQQAIAAYEIGGAWLVLTAKRLSVDSYTAALNTALQALFGLKGEPVKRPKRSAS